MYIDAQYTDLKLPVDILIGTVPLRQSIPSVPFVPQSQAVITNQPPSAPPINQANGDNFDICMSSPCSLVCACLLKVVRRSSKHVIKLFHQGLDTGVRTQKHVGFFGTPT